MQSKEEKAQEYAQLQEHRDMVGKLLDEAFTPPFPSWRVRGAKTTEEAVKKLLSGEDIERIVDYKSDYEQLKQEARFNKLRGELVKVANNAFVKENGIEPFINLVKEHFHLQPSRNFNYGILSVIKP